MTTQPTLLYRDPDYSNRIRIAEHVLMRTQEIVEGPFILSRFVQGSYHPTLGFLCSCGTCRIPVEVFIRDPHTYQYERFTDDEHIWQSINAFIDPEKLTAIHYTGARTIDSFVVGLEKDVEEKLPERFRPPNCQ